VIKRANSVDSSSDMLAMKFDGVAASSDEYDAEIDYDNEHRCAEPEHEFEP